MRKITAIEAQKRNPGRVNIYLDDQFAFGLSRIVAAWLSVGQVLSEEKIAALQAEEAREAAFQRACRFLGYRPRSEDEVRKNLEKHHIPAETIEHTLGRLRDLGLLGDADFARAWVENRSTFRPRSKRALGMELRQKGIAREVIQSVLDEVGDEEPLALQAAHKQARKLTRCDWPEFRQKLGAFLARRGFSYEVIVPVVRAVWETTRTQQADEIYDEELT